MSKFTNIIIGITLLLSMMSCEDDSVSRFTDNTIKVQLLDSATNSPISKQEVSLYYAIEKISSKEELYEFGVRPNPIYDEMTLYYYLQSSAKIRITLNSLNDFSIIKELYKSDTLEIGSHRTMYNPNEFASGFYMLKYYINDTLINNMKILIAKNCFVVLDDYAWNKVGNPYMTLVSDENGIVNVDMDKFKDIGTQIQRIYDNGNDMGVFEVINGFHCIASLTANTGTKQVAQTIRIAECKDKRFTWKVNKSE